MAGNASIPISVTTAPMMPEAVANEKQTIDYVGPFDHIAHE
jgi:hypothetical protein